MGRLLDSPVHLLLLLIVVLLLFGYKRLPDASRGLARSLRIFKAEMKQMQDDDTPAPRPTPREPTEPLEGRVVDGKTRPPAEHHRDA